LERIPHGISVYGADRRVSMFNRAYTEVMAGAPLQLGDHLEEVIRRRAEQEISRRAAEMSVMLTSIRHGIMLWGADRRLIATNHVAAELLGHPPGSLVPGKSQADLVDEMLARGAFGR